MFSSISTLTRMQPRIINNLLQLSALGSTTTTRAVVSYVTNILAIAYDTIRNVYYVGGQFTSLTSSDGTIVASNNVAVWNVSSQTWSPLGSGVDNTVYSIAYDSSTNKLYVGGAFISAGSTSVIYVAVWNVSSQTWSRLGSATQNGVDSHVYSIVYNSSTNLLYVGGILSGACSSSQPYISANRVIVWNVSSQTWSLLGSASQNGVNNGVRSLVYNSSTNLLYVGGDFTTASSTTQLNISAKYVAKWDVSSQTWSPLGSASQNGVNSLVNSIFYNSSNNLLYVGGNFTTVSSTTQLNISALRVAVWNVSSQTWSPLGSDSQNGVSTNVNTVVYNSSTNLLYVGGNFTTVSSNTQLNISANRVAVWDVSSQTWSLLGSASQNGVNATVNSMFYNSSNNLLSVVGAFYGAYDANNTYNTYNHILNFNTIQNTWSILEYNYTGMISNGTNGKVSACVYDIINNVYYIGGSFTTVSSSTQLNISATNVAVWNVSSQTWSPLGSASQNGVNNYVLSMVYDNSNNLLYVGGYFTTASSSSQLNISANKVAVWNVSNQIWSPLGSASQNGVNVLVRSLVYNSSNNKLYVGGYFTTASSNTQLNISAKSVAVWEVSSQTWSLLGSASQNGATSHVFSMVYDSSTNLLYIGGSFTTVSSSTQLNISATNVAKWDVSSQTWSPLGSASQNGVNGTVNSMFYNSSNNLLYVGGIFGTVSSTTQLNISALRVAVWNVSNQIWSTLGSASQNGVNATVNTVVYNSSTNKLYVGGNFTTASSNTQLNISAKSVAVWNVSNSSWIPINSTKDPAQENGVSGPSPSVNTLSYNNNNLFVGGSFYTATSSISYSAYNACIYSYL